MKYHIFQQEFDDGRETAIEFFKAHYFRPDGDDRGWEENKGIHYEVIERLASFFDKYQVDSLIMMYHTKNMELTILIPCTIPTELYEEDALKEIREVLDDDMTPTVEIVGCENHMFVYHQQY